jgi:DNA-binding PadR family transcriptional regulator
MSRNRAPSRQTRDVLAVLLGRPADWRHGYELAKLAGLSSGTLYPLLIRLHERGFLDAKWLEPERPGRPARHAYRLSDAGLAYARSLDSDAVVARLGREILA